MTSLILNPLAELVSKITFRSINITLLTLLSLAFCQSALAQDIKPRPVARLISDPTTAAGYSRARRVMPAETTPGTAAIVGSNVSSTLAGATPIERRAFEQTNQARLENGLTPLVWD